MSDIIIVTVIHINVFNPAEEMDLYGTVLNHAALNALSASNIPYNKMTSRIQASKREYCNGIKEIEYQLRHMHAQASNEMTKKVGHTKI